MRDAGKAQEIKTVNKKIIVFKKEQHQAGINYTDQQDIFPVSFRFTVFQFYCREIINENCYKQYDDIIRDEPHVKHTAGDEQQHLPVFARQKIKQGKHDREKNQKIKGGKKHAVV